MQRDPLDFAVDVAVIGAGPAGLAAAATAAEQGLSVVLLDEQVHAGGQIYRDVARAGADRLQVLGHDYAAGRALVERFTQSTARHVGGAAVWNVTRDRVIHYLKGGRSQSMTAGQVILCTGAMERPFPMPGWTLPGVMTAGAAQILLKSAGVAPSQPGVLAGCGPLLYLLAWQYLRAGVEIGAIVDTTQRGDYLRALRHIVGALAGWRDMRKGLGLIRSIRGAGIPFYRGATELAVEGDERATALRFRVGAASHLVPTDLVLTGVTAQDGTLDIQGQTRQVLEKIDAHLAKVGIDKTRMLSVQIWLKDIERDFAGMNEVWDAWVPKGAGPARATGESKLAHPDLLVEILVTAAV